VQINDLKDLDCEDMPVDEEFDFELITFINAKDTSSCVEIFGMETNGMSYRFDELNLAGVPSSINILDNSTSILVALDTTPMPSHNPKRL